MATDAVHASPLMYCYAQWMPEKHALRALLPSLYVGGEVVSLHRALDLTLDDRPQARFGQFKQLSVGAVIVSNNPSSIHQRQRLKPWQQCWNLLRRCHPQDVSINVEISVYQTIAHTNDQLPWNIRVRVSSIS